MFPSHPKCHNLNAQRGRGFTLVELIMSMAITSMVTVILSGLVMAVQTAWSHTKGLEDADIQARASIDRIKFMVGRAGLYQVAGQPTTLGLAVVDRGTSNQPFPDVLVVWSGRFESGMAEMGVREQLPLISELVVYTVDQKNAERLVETSFPDNFTSIDFRAVDFSKTILSLLKSPDARPLRICDRLRTSKSPGVRGAANAAQRGNVRFELSVTPSDADLAKTTPGTQQWIDLPWSQGIASSDSGMRQATLRIELQVEPYTESSSDKPELCAAIPFLGSASYRYVYQP